MRLTRRLVLAGLATSLAIACGSRTGLLAPEEFDGSFDAHADVHDAHHEPDVIEEDVTPIPDAFPDVPIISDCPDAGDTLVYVLGGSNELYSFYPPTLAFTSIGTIVCMSNSTPNSMAVTRSGIAFAGFLDGTLFEVSTANAACKSTTYTKNQLGILTFGMGYAGIADGGESLFITGNGNKTGLGTIDTTSFTLSLIGQLNPPQGNCELSGTGDGRLFGFCPVASGSVLVDIDPTTAKITASHMLNAGMNASSYAFAFWGGDFWIFTGVGSVTSTVTKYDPIAQTETDVATAPITIVGAGVSTCAPE